MRETSTVLGVSVRTVEHDWTRAKAYLDRALAPASSAQEADACTRRRIRAVADVDPILRFIR